MEGNGCFKVVVLSAVILILFVNVHVSRHIKRSSKTIKGIHHTAHHKVFTEIGKRGDIPLDELEVDGTKYQRIGCFRDAWNRVIPALEGEHQLLMEPNYKARKFALIKCARAAMDKHLMIFGIENGGQCFGADDEKSLDKYGSAVECRRDGKGGPWSLQAYKFTILPINGGFSPWSRWTTCSKTCDHGVRRRMRTCSNPSPSNDGKDCSGLGPSVEGEICKDKECPTVLIDEAEAGNTVRPTTPSTTPSNTPVPNAETPPTTPSINDKENLKTNEQSNIESQAQAQAHAQTKGSSSELLNKPNDPSKEISETNKSTNEQNEKVSTKTEASSPSPPLPKDVEKNIPSKEASQPSVSANVQNQNISTKEESSSERPSLQKDRETNNPKSPSKETSQPSVSANVQNQNISPKEESSSERPSLQKDRETNNPTNSSKEASQPSVNENVQNQKISPKEESSSKSPSLRETNNPTNPSKEASQPSVSENVQNQKISPKEESSSKSPSLRETNNPTNPSKEASQPSVSENVQNQKEEPSSKSFPTQSNKQKSISTSSKTATNAKESDKKPKTDSGASQNDKPVASQTLASQESSQTGYQVYQDPGQTGSQVYQEPNQPQAAPGSEPYQFIDEPEDQREPNSNLYSMSSMHQSENFKAHEQANMPGTSQDIDPRVVEDTYNGGPVVPSSAVQLNTPLGPVVMGEVSPLNSNFNPNEVQNDQPTNDDCFCPKKVCDAKADIAFLVDGSSDIPQIYFAHVLDFMKALTRGFVAKDNQVSLVAYGDDAASAFGFSPVANLREIDDSIDSVSYMGGDPRTGNALTKVKNGVFGMNSRKDANHALVLLTSGSSSDDTIQAATELRDAGIKLTTIGLGKLANVKELIDISSEPKSSHVFTAFLDTLPDIMDDIVKGVCSDIKGKLNDKTECLCENNKAKAAKQKSPATLSEPGGGKDYPKESPTTKPKQPTSDKISENKNSKNQSQLNSNDAKGSNISNEKTKGEQNKSDANSNEQSPKNTDSNEQSLKSDSKNKQTNKETSTGAGDSISKLPSEEKPSNSKEKPEQSQEKGPHSQEEPSSSQDKEPAKNTPIKEVKTDLKVDAPVPQVDKNEKAIPKKDENEDNKLNNSNPSEVASQNEQKPPESTKEPTNVPDNTNSTTSKETPQIGLFSLTTSGQSTDTSQKEPDRGDSSKANEQEQENKIPSAAEVTTESPAAPDKPTEPQPLKEQQQTIATSSKEEHFESNASNKTTNDSKSKESGENKPSPEKVLEATESSFPPGNKSKPKEQPQESADQQSQGKNTSENSKPSGDKDLNNEKIIAQQVEVPNPNSKEPKKPTTPVQDNKRPSEDKKEESSTQNPQQQEPSSSQVAPRPGYYMLGSPLPVGGGSSGQTVHESNSPEHPVSGIADLSSSHQQNEHPQNTNHSTNTETNSDSSLKECSVNLGVVLDSKTTAYGYQNNAKKLLQFAKKVTHMFPVSPEGNRVGMMVYSGSPKLKVVHFDHYLDANTMDKAIDSASYLNMEIKTGRVLNFAQEHLFSRTPSGKQNVLLLITDGVSYDDVTNPSLELKRRGVEIFAIGVGDKVVRKELESIASDSPDEHVIMTSYDVSDALLDDIKNRICTSAQRKDTVAAKPIPKHANCGKADVGFVIDGSRTIESLGKGHFENILEFVKNVSLALPVISKSVRIGAVVYGTEPFLEIPFDSINSSEDISLAFDSIRYPSTSTMTGKALEFARETLFGVPSTRRGIPKILVVVTQGSSRDNVREPSEDLHRDGVEVLSVGLGPIYDRIELENMSSLPSSDHVLTVDYPDLQSQVEELRKMICRFARKQELDI